MAVLQANCGGSGGGSGGGNTQTVSVFPLRTAMMNIYNNPWQMSGTIAAQIYTYLSASCNGQLGGCFIDDTPGTFTSTFSSGGTNTIGGVTVNVSNIARAEIFGGSPTNVSYQLSFNTDYSQLISSNVCSMNIPATASIGYTGILSCTSGSPAHQYSISITGAGGDKATLQIVTDFGTENYTVGSNGSVGPASITQSGNLKGDLRVYRLTMSY